MRRYQGALIGCGRIGCETREDLITNAPAGVLPYSHADAMSANSARLSFVAAVDQDSGRRSYVRQKYNVPVFQKMEDLFPEFHPDLICVATRTAPREAIISHLLEKKVRALHVEKPFASSLRSTLNLAEGLHRQKTFLSYGTTRRHMDIYRKAKLSLESGDIGALRRIEVQYGKSLLMWTHPHSLDAIIYLSGACDFESVEAACEFEPSSLKGNFLDADPLVIRAEIDLGNGITGMITPDTGQHVVIYGTSGRLEIQDNCRTLRCTGNNGEKIWESPSTPPQISGTQRSLASLLDCLDNRITEGPMPLSHLILNQKMLFGIAQSALQNGKGIRSSDINPDLTLSGRFGNNFA